MAGPRPGLKRPAPHAADPDVGVVGQLCINYAGWAWSFTSFLPPRPARSPRGHRGRGDDRAVADLPARAIPSARLGDPTLPGNARSYEHTQSRVGFAIQPATTRFQERPGDPRPLHDHGAGPAGPEHRRMTKILV